MAILFVDGAAVQKLFVRSMKLTAIGSVEVTHFCWTQHFSFSESILGKRSVRDLQRCESSAERWNVSERKLGPAIGLHLSSCDDDDVVLDQRMAKLTEAMPAALSPCLLLVAVMVVVSMQNAHASLSILIGERCAEPELWNSAMYLMASVIVRLAILP